MNAILRTNHGNAKSPLSFRFVVTCFAVFFCLNWVTIAANAKEPQEILASIEAAWRKSQREIHSIQCSGRMSSTYPKGGLTSSLSKVAPPKEGVPEKDLHFDDQQFRWVIDFDNLKLRRESAFVVPRFTVGSPTVAFEKEVGIDLFSNNEYRYVRERGANPWLEKKNWEVKISPAGLPFIGFDALPILWIAGCMSTEPPRPKSLKSIDNLARWSFRGEAVRNGESLFVITMPEGQSSSVIRELWVSKELPHRVHFCNVRTPRGVPWQLEVSYQASNAVLVPASIKYTEFDYPRTAVRYHGTYTFNEFLINESFNESVFDHSLKPGMTVSYHAKRGLFEVARDGTIVPYQEQRDNRGLFLRILIVVAFCVVAASLVWWLLRRRRFTSTT